MLQKLIHRLFVVSPNIGGRLSTDSKVKGYTELKKDGILYQAHLSYKIRGSWFDWGLLNWAGYNDPISAQIIMMIDLSDCVICNDLDINPDSSGNVEQVHNFPHLTPEKWVVVLVCKGSAIDHDTLSNTHFVSKITMWYDVHDDSDVYIVPWSTSIGPCFLFENNNYNGPKVDGKYECDKSSSRIPLMSNWGDLFL